MEDNSLGNLQVRIVNCLQTILELEQDLRRLDLGHVLLKEFDTLKSFLSKVDTVEIEEDDVVRIEKATENFLDELREPLSHSREKNERDSRLVQ